MSWGLQDSGVASSRWAIVAVPLTVLLLTSCSSYNGRPTQPAIDCGDLLATVVHRVQTGDTAGAINTELDWLTRNCSAEYQVFADYASTRGTAEQFGPDSCESLRQYISRDAINLLASEGLCSGAPESSVESPAIESQPGGGIPWDDAINNVGTVQRVCGPFAGMGNSGDDVFLNLGRDYPDIERFQIVLWDVGGVELLPIGTIVCTSGPITSYQGVAQIELESTSPVEVYG